jgi:hypothetical protein
MTVNAWPSSVSVRPTIEDRRRSRWPTTGGSSDDVFLARLILVGRKRASDRGLHAEDVE